MSLFKFGEPHFVNQSLLFFEELTRVDTFSVKLRLSQLFHKFGLQETEERQIWCLGAQPQIPSDCREMNDPNCLGVWTTRVL